MSVEIVVGTNVRHWIRFIVEDPTPEEIAILEGPDSEEALELAHALDLAGRLEEVADDSDDSHEVFGEWAEPAVVDCDPESQA
jgi:hypothetical protein